MKTVFIMRTRQTILRLAWGVLLTTAGLFGPTEVQAQVKRLETFINHQGAYYHRASYNDGASWSAWMRVPSRLAGTSRNLDFNGPPGVLHSGTARLALVAIARDGYLVYTDYTPLGGWWAGQNEWHRIPGDTFAGGVRIGGYRYYWNADSFPSFVSWGLGRGDVFMHATREDGAVALLHRYHEHLSWERTAPNWEVLGTGRMQGSPAAAAWESGRLDVFVRGGGNELVHKYFANGQWSGWETLGDEVVSSPAVTSAEPGHLDVYMTGNDMQLRHRVFGGRWFPAEPLGGTIKPETAPAVTTKGPGNIEVFVYGMDNRLYQRSYNYGWSDRVSDEAPSSGTATLYWNPF